MLLALPAAKQTQALVSAEEKHRANAWGSSPQPCRCYIVASQRSIVSTWPSPAGLVDVLTPRVESTSDAVDVGLVMDGMHCTYLDRLHSYALMSLLFGV